MFMDYFLHIPKTAGTSLTRFMDQFYDPSEIFPYQTWDKVLKNYPIDVSQYKLARGHFGYCAHYIFGMQNLNYMTLLRNPVERTLSQYHHMTVDRKHNNWLYDFPYSKIKCMLRKSSWVVSNIQVKHLAYDENILNKEIPHSPERYIFLENYECVDMEALFQKACENLDKCFFVGFFESLHKSVDRLCDLMQWERKELHHENLLKNRPKIEDFKKKVIKKIESLNEWDFKLYDYAKSKFS